MFRSIASDIESDEDISEFQGDLELDDREAMIKSLIENGVIIKTHEILKEKYSLLKKKFKDPPKDRLEACLMLETYGALIKLCADLFVRVFSNNEISSQISIDEYFSIISEIVPISDKIVDITSRLMEIEFGLKIGPDSLQAILTTFKIEDRSDDRINPSSIV